MKLHVGCAMWTYAPWQGRYLPHPLSPRERLSAYATWCNAVEGNTTFYAIPALDTVKSWAEQTAPDFRLVLKLPKAITHERRLADADEPLRAFLAAIERSARAPTPCGSSCRRPSARPTSAPSRPSSAVSPASTGTAWKSGTASSSRSWY